MEIEGKNNSQVEPTLGGFAITNSGVLMGSASCIGLDLDYVFRLIQGSPKTPIPKLEKPGMDPMVGCVLIIQVQVLVHWMDPDKNWAQVWVHGFHTHRPKQLKPCAHVVQIFKVFLGINVLNGGIKVFEPCFGLKGLPKFRCRPII